MTLKRIVGPLIFSVFAAGVFSACSKKDDKGVAAQLQVGQLAATGTRSMSREAASAYASADVVASTTHYSYATVDGLKINVQSVDLVSSGNYFRVTNWAAPKELEIGAGVTGAISIDEGVTLTPGNYTGARITYDNAFAVKAYCQTSAGFYYTTSAGVVRSGASAPVSMPNDYDYYSYAFAETSTAESPASTTDTAQAQTDFNFTVADAPTNKLAVLVDNSYLVTCYDGGEAGGPGTGTGSLSPFGWSNNNGHTKDEFFPNGQPHFGMSYIPMFVWLSNDASEAPPTSDTYFAAATSGGLTPPYDVSTLAVTTVAFRGDGTLFAMRTRVGTGHQVELEQFFNNFELQNDSTYTADNGEWICDAGYTNCRIIRDRKMTLIKQIDDTATHAWIIEDGTECGLTGTDPGHPEWGNRYRACLGAPVTTYWKKAPR